MKRRTSRRPALTPNAPLGRLGFIRKTYEEKQPWVVLDTLSVIFNTIGIDEPCAELEDELKRQGADVWGAEFVRMVTRLRAFCRGEFYPGLPSPSESLYDNGLPYSDQNDYWWFGDPRMDRFVIDKPGSTLSEKLTLVLELVESNHFADGAMREAHDADGIFPWVAREMSRLSKHTISELGKLSPTDMQPPAYERTTLVMSWPHDPTQDASEMWGAGEAKLRDQRDYAYGDYSRAVRILRNSGNLFAQWAKAKRVDIMKLSLAEVIEATKDFKYTGKIRQGKIVLRLADGWTVQTLQGRRELEGEGKALSHCVGTYVQKVDNGQHEIYSLRDPDGVPYVTMDWKNERPEDDINTPPAPVGVVPVVRGEFKQVFGFDNSNIGDPEFNQYVFSAGQENDPPLTEKQVPQVVELIRSMVVEFIDKVKGGDARGLLLTGASLSGRDLTNAKLNNTNLTNAKLTGAKLTGADLSYTNLTDADLTGADLSYAKMSNANLWDADLSHADLIGTNLFHANLNGTNLTGANLTGAEYNWTTSWPAGFDPVAAGAVKT